MSIFLTIVVGVLIGYFYSIRRLYVMKEKWSSALSLAVCFGTLTAGELIPTAVLIIYNIITYPTNPRIVGGYDVRFPTRVMKLQELGHIHPSLLAVGFTLTTVTMIFLCGVWANIAVSFRQVSAHKGKTAERVCIAYLIFAFTVLIPTAAIYTLWTVNAVIVIAIVLLLTVAFSWTAYKIHAIDKILSGSDQSFEDSSKRWSARVTMKRIQNTSFILAFLCFAATVTSAIYGLGPIRFPGYVPPVFSIASREISYRLLILAIALCNLTVAFYLI
jgi:hypothetical protein